MASDTPTQETMAPSSAHPHRLFLIAAAALIFIGLLFPGDIPFINDEALLLNNALIANERGELAPHGLKGTVGIHYGPIPTWFYQVALHITSDPVTIALAKNAISLFLLLGAVVGLAKALSLNPLPALLLFMSPFIYHLNRTLWDEGFTVALSAWMALCYLKFAQNKQMRWLFAGMALSVLFVYIQIKTVFMIFGFYGAVFLLEYRTLLKKRLATLAAFAVVSAISFPYFFYIWRNLELGKGGTPDRLQSVWGSLTGSRFFSFAGWPEAYLPELYSSAFFFPKFLTLALIVITCLSFLTFAAGLVGMVKESISAVKIGTLAPCHKATVLCILVLLSNSVFYLLTGQPHRPHYHFGIWFAFFFFQWSCMARLLELGKRGQWPLMIQGAAQFILWLSMIGFVHVNGGNRSEQFGATLNNQLEVAASIYSRDVPAHIDVRVENYKKFPHSAAVLQRLLSRASGPRTRGQSTQQLIIDYRDPDAAHSGWITVYERD